eukprot:COSAG02_NODE_1523_length_12140_cov_16.419650_4_plen_501_part_00
MEAHQRSSGSRSKRRRSPERHHRRPHGREPDYSDDRRAPHAGNTSWRADAGICRSGGSRCPGRPGDAFSKPPRRVGSTALLTLAQINESASAGLEPSKLSLLGPVVMAEWKLRNKNSDLPPKGNGARVYPANDSGWIGELLQRPWDELSAMVQQSREKTAARQREAQLKANGTAVSVAVAAAAVTGTVSSSAPQMVASLGANSGITSFCKWCEQWKPKDSFSKKGMKEHLCLQCSNGARFVCFFCKRDYADEDGRPDGNFAKDNRETEYGAVCNNCIVALWDRRKQDESEAALAKQKSEHRVAAFEAELAKEKTQRAAAEQTAAKTAAAAQELSCRARQAEQKIEQQNRDFEEMQRVERQKLEQKQRHDRLEHDAKQARLIREKEALKKERDGIKKQNVELQEQAARAEREAKEARQQARQAEERRERAEEDGLCLVCWENGRNVFFLPCSHLVVCDVCGEGLRECPTCKRDIQQKKRVHVVQMVSDAAVSALGAVVGST